MTRIYYCEKYNLTRDRFESVSALSDPNVSYVEHLDKIIQDYKRIYKEMSPYFSSDLYIS